jgi:hypothetical protein
MIIKMIDKFIPLLGAAALGGCPPAGGLDGGITTLLSPVGGGGVPAPGAVEGVFVGAISAGGCSLPIR